jgi:hypothetical protein
MNKKKKLSKTIKEMRRVTEAEKALSKGFLENRQQPVTFKQTVSATKDVTNNYALPVKQIKIDLIGNVAFMCLSIALLVLLRITNLGFEQLRPFLKF